MSVLDHERHPPARDTEDAPALADISTKERLAITSEKAGDTIWVDWNGPNDPDSPRNWSNRRRWLATLIVSCFTFLSALSSSMISPAGAQLAGDLDITSTALVAMSTSIFVLGFAVGGLVLAPLSELYGRAILFKGANIFYIAWNTGCGFAQNKSQLMAFRFLSGVGASAPLTVGAGALGDLWRAEERGKAMTIYSLAPLLGPVIGPVCGGWIAERSTWRWVFWSTSIAAALIQFLGVLYLKETFAPVLLERKAKAIKQKGVENTAGKTIKTVYEKGEDRGWKQIFSRAMSRPFQLSAREPIVQLLGIYMAFIYGVFYLFLTTMPAIFSEVYHEGPGIAGLHYLALGIGMAAASQASVMLLDPVYVHFKERNNGVGEPEFRLPSMIPGTLVLPFGLLLSGWSAQNNLHWAATDVGIACVGAGMIINFQVIQTYVVDAFTLHAASALAAVSLLRCLAGFGFPLFAPAMYHKLGYGKGDTILAAFSVVLGCPAPWLFWKYGKQIRMSSRYTQKEKNEDSP